MSTFFRKPPTSDNVQEWLDWQEREERKMRGKKAARTKTLPYSEVPQSAMMKVGGVWKQAAQIGVVSDGAEGEFHLEPVCEANQEKVIDMATYTHTHELHGKSGAQKRRQRRENRARKEGRLVKVWRNK